MNNMIEYTGRYYVLYNSTTDMFKKENPVDFGPAFSLTNSNNQHFSYYKPHRVQGDFYFRDKEIRLYDSRRKHRYMKKEEVQELYPEMFTPYDGAEINDKYYRLALRGHGMIEYIVTEVFNKKICVQRPLRAQTITLSEKSEAWMKESVARDKYPEMFI